MASSKIQDIRNLCLCGHGSSGKTTLADAMLTSTNTVSRQASVDDGTSICDFDDEEKHHKYTIESSLIHFEHGGKYFNVIDTPGYPDFIGQTIGALRAVDAAAIVIEQPEHAVAGDERRRPERLGEHPFELDQRRQVAHLDHRVERGARRLRAAFERRHPPILRIDGAGALDLAEREL